MKKEPTMESTPLIEKMKPKPSPIFEEKGNRNPTGGVTCKIDANRNWWFPLEPGNWPTLVFTMIPMWGVNLPWPQMWSPNVPRQA